jgi:hypothetical protein
MLTLLLVLACPVSMGLMMWFMMRGGHQEPNSPPEHIEQRRRIAAMERELAELRQARVADKTEDAVPQSSASR